MRFFSSRPKQPAEEVANSLVEMPRPPGAWLFGKIPAHGDFISRGVTPEFHEALDLWLSAEVARARARFEDFDTRYAAAAPWFFVDRDPRAAWSGGALCLSVDRVGRRFPILVAAPAESAETAGETALAALELTFTTFSQGWDADQLIAALDSITIDRGHGPAPEHSLWAIEAEDGTRIEMPGRFPEGLIERMLELAA